MVLTSTLVPNLSRSLLFIIPAQEILRNQTTQWAIEALCPDFTLSYIPKNISEKLLDSHHLSPPKDETTLKLASFVTVIFLTLCFAAIP